MWISRVFGAEKAGVRPSESMSCFIEVGLSRRSLHTDRRANATASIHTQPESRQEPQDRHEGLTSGASRASRSIYSSTQGRRVDVVVSSYMSQPPHPLLQRLPSWPQQHIYQLRDTKIRVEGRNRTRQFCSDRLIRGKTERLSRASSRQLEGCQRSQQTPVYPWKERVWMVTLQLLS
jgi:hypothetical protein